MLFGRMTALFLKKNFKYYNLLKLKKNSDILQNLNLGEKETF